MKLSRILMRFLLWLSGFGALAILADKLADSVIKLMCYGL